MRQVRRREYAPSRLAYRYERLMLTPRFRLFLRWGLPVLTLAVVAGIWAADPSRRQGLADRVAEARAAIEARPEFAVGLMAVDGASREVAAEIRDVVALDFPVSSFDIDLAAVKATVESIDAVRAARVRVASGGILEVVVTERLPVAVWRGRDGLFLVDAEGVAVASLPARIERPDLPLLAGEGAETAVAEALSVLDAAAPLRGRVRGLVRIGERRWDLVLSGGQRLMLPETGAVAAVDRIVALDRASDILSRDVTHLDFRNPDRPTARLGGDALAARAAGPIQTEAR